MTEDDGSRSGVSLTMAVENRVQESRVAEGYSRARFASHCGVNEKTLRNVETGRRTVAPSSIGRIVRGFLILSEPLKKYSFAYLFPKGYPGWRPSYLPEQSPDGVMGQRLETSSQAAISPDDAEGDTTSPDDAEGDTTGSSGV